jgi:hypothetical protein
MLMIYNSPNYVVMEFGAGDGESQHGGYEIMDKYARREIFIDGAMAEHFRQSVNEMMQNEPTVDEIDEYLGRFDCLMQQRVIVH